MTNQNEDDDLVFSINEGAGSRLNVYVVGQPEDYRVLISDPDRDAMIGIDKDLWKRIVARVEAQF